MALKDLVLTGDERVAFEIARKVWDDLGPFQLETLMEDIMAALCKVRAEK